MNRLVFVLLVGIIMTGCKKSSDMEFFDTAINIIYQDTVGNDLLDTATASHYVVANMRLFYLINGEKVEFFKSNLDYPRGIRLLDYADTFKDTLILGVFPYEGEGTESEIFETTTFLQLSDTDTDTIRCEMKKTENALYTTKVWYNDILKWDAGLRLFTIIK